MNRLCVFLLLLAVLVVFSACKNESKQVQKELEKLTKVVKDAVDKSDVPTSVSEISEEVKKLHSFEYKLIEFGHDIPPNEIAKTLNELGKDRWNCGKFSEKEFSVQVLCKRPPNTVLRYVPKSLINR